MTPDRSEAGMTAVAQTRRPGAGARRLGIGLGAGLVAALLASCGVVTDISRAPGRAPAPAPAPDIPAMRGYPDRFDGTFSGFWDSTTGVVPDNRNQLLGFSVGGATYSTGVDDAALQVRNHFICPHHKPLLRGISALYLYLDGAARVGFALLARPVHFLGRYVNSYGDALLTGGLLGSLICRCEEAEGQGTHNKEDKQSRHGI